MLTGIRLTAMAQDLLKTAEIEAEILKNIDIERELS
jgi:hypothetical protein